MLIAGLVLAFLFGWARGGSLKKLSDLPIRQVYLLILPLLMEAAQAQLLLRAQWMTPLLSFGMTILQYLLIFIFVLLNSHMWQVLLYGVGSGLNFLAITANAGAMPITDKVLNLGGSSAKFAALVEGRYYTYEIIGEGTRLPFLGDVILIPGLLPQCVSIGDIVLLIGVFCLVVGGMGKGRKIRDRMNKGDILKRY